MTSNDPGPDRARLLDELHELLDERPDSAKARQQRLLTEISQVPDLPIVLYGAGNLGRRTQRLLAGRGFEVAAFIDNDWARWGTTLEGVPIMSPVDASERFAAAGGGGHRHDLAR